MNKKTIAVGVLFLAASAAACSAACCATSPQPRCAKPNAADAVKQVLSKLEQTTKALRSYQADVEYVFRQPLLESQTLRKGVLYYLRLENTSRLRVNFNTLKQDDEEQQRYLDHYIFDGIWLTRVDYQIEAVERYQLVDPNELKDSNRPADPFELLSRNFPIVGFSNVEDLDKAFTISRVAQDDTQKPAFIRLHLEVKPGSVYEQDYTSMDVWIDRKEYLPARMVAVTTEEDIYQIDFLTAKINEKIDEKVFYFTIPEGFTVEEKRLKPEQCQKAEKASSQ
jgi:hypothetical protein